jgi:hypothetical protein
LQAGPFNLPVANGSNNGNSVTDSQVVFEQFTGKLPHSSAYRYNRYTKRWLDYDKMRAMRRDPTIALARDAAVAPIIASTWTFELTDKTSPDWIKTYCERYLLPLRTKYLRTALYGEIDFGWRAYEKVLNVVRDRQLGIKVIPQRLKPLLNDNTWARYDDEGDFDGLLHQNPMNNNWYNIDFEHSMFANFDDDGLGNYNDPALIRCEQAYDEWHIANDTARRYDEKISGAVWVIEYPEGTNYYKGTPDMPNYDIAKDIAYQIKASGHLILPNKLLASVETELQEFGQAGWRVSLVESGAKGADFVTRLDYLDKLKIRGLGVLERAIVEGNYGTKAEAESHINLMLLNMQLKHQDLTDYFNQVMTNHFTAINANIVDAGHFVAQPLTDERRDLFLQLYTALLTQPDSSAETIQRTDIPELMRVVGVPQLSEEQYRENSVSGIVSLIQNMAANNADTDTDNQAGANAVPAPVAASRGWQPLQPFQNLALNCGTGDGGFKPGNNCQDGGGGTVNIFKVKVDKAVKKFKKNPTTANYKALQQAKAKHRQSLQKGYKTEAPKPKPKPSPQKAKENKEQANKTPDFNSAIKPSKSVSGAKEFRGPNASDKWGYQHYEGYAKQKKRSPEATSLKMYQGQDYQRVNSFLRNGGDPTKEAGAAALRIKQLDKLIADAPSVPEPIIVHRGLKTHIKGLKAGDTISDNAYMSTSLEPAISQQFAGLVGPKRKGESALMRISVPKGAKGLYADVFNEIDEQEFILPRATQLKITKVLHKNGVQHIEAELLHNG